MEAWKTYAAVAENISTTRPLVKIPSAAEKAAVKTPTIASRCLILPTKYRTTVARTGKIEAQVVPTSVLSRSKLS